MSDELLVWKDKELTTYGDIMRAMDAFKDKEEAQAFLAVYRKQNPKYADANIGYIIGYFDQDKARRLYEWLGTPHPVLGGPGGYGLSQEEVFQKGKELGEKAIAKASRGSRRS